MKLFLVITVAVIAVYACGGSDEPDTTKQIPEPVKREESK